MSLLRPVYTEYLFKQLQKQSINVYGAAGQGRERLLDDLKTLATPAGIWVLSADMKAYRHNYTGLINDLNHQLSQQLASTDTSLSLEQQLDQHPSQTVWILLPNFDAILNATQLDKQFGIGFFNQLNALKNRPHCYLLCMTERPFQQYQLYAEQIHSLSPLDLKPFQLKPLTLEECKHELQRQDLRLQDKHFNALLDCIHNHPTPYLFLGFACDQIKVQADQGKLFKDRLTRWQKQFTLQNKRSLFSGVDKCTNHLKIIIRHCKPLLLTLTGLAAVFTAVSGKAQLLLDFLMKLRGKP
ncbi:MAG: hypothetical protein NTV43_15915 [Methylococcales bacterium]|nr:hypothetical protein [Methylococcales bacterium]